jgi:hypothetical protein
VFEVILSVKNAFPDIIFKNAVLITIYSPKFSILLGHKNPDFMVTFLFRNQKLYFKNKNE